MRERAELVHGTIAFLAPPGGGTIVRLRVPLAVNEDAHVAGGRTV